jgi:hypothetical protein
VLLIIVAYIIYVTCFGDKPTCKQYGSKFACDYVVNQAPYKVYYWKNFFKDNTQDETLVGKAIGLADCESKAKRFAAQQKEEWNPRAYICVMDNTSSKPEKHRLLQENGT